MRPQTVIRNDNKIFAEVDMDFHSTVYRDDWPYGKLRPGDTISVLPHCFFNAYMVIQIKFFALYTLNDDEKVVEFKAATWPPGAGISKYPRLGASNNQRAAFMAFIAAFSVSEFETFPKFYTSDVVLSVPGRGTFKGFESVVNFYKQFFAKIQESLEVEQLICDDAAIYAKMTANFTGLQDSTNYFGDFKKGATMSLKVYVVYGLRDGLISSIDVGTRD